jgi:hypothetical protein
MSDTENVPEKKLAYSEEELSLGEGTSNSESKYPEASSSLFHFMFLVIVALCRRSVRADGGMGCGRWGGTLVSPPQQRIYRHRLSMQ